MAVLKSEGKTFPTKTEVLVIGAGACGTIAALAAKERGAEVVILERDAKPSGSTSLSSGQIPAAGTKLQRAAGLIDDTPELLYQDILAKAHGECDHAIARLIAPFGTLSSVVASYFSFDIASRTAASPTPTTGGSCDR